MSASLEIFFVVSKKSLIPGNRREPCFPLCPSEVPPGLFGIDQENQGKILSKMKLVFGECPKQGAKRPSSRQKRAV